MDQLILYVGFLIAAYAVIANDVIQTLGTFIASNTKIKWWYLWAFAGFILTATILYGWYANTGMYLMVGCPKFPCPILCRGGIFWLPFLYWLLPESVFRSVLHLWYWAYSPPDSLLRKWFLNLSLVTRWPLWLHWSCILWYRGNLNPKHPFVWWTKRSKGDTGWSHNGFLPVFVVSMANTGFCQHLCLLPRQLGVNELLVSLGVILLIMAYIFRVKGARYKKSSIKNRTLNI